MSLQILLSQIPNTTLEVPPFFKYTSDSQLTHFDMRLFLLSLSVTFEPTDINLWT